MDPVEAGIAITQIPWIPVPEEVTVPDIVSPDTDTIEASMFEIGPADSAGLVTVIEVDELAVIVPAVVPKSTAVAPVRLVPVMVTEVPPAVVPEVGVIEVTVGAEVTVVERMRAPVEPVPSPVTKQTLIEGQERP